MAHAKAAQENPSPAAVATLAKLAEAAKAGIRAKQKENQATDRAPLVRAAVRRVAHRRSEGVARFMPPVRSIPSSGWLHLGV